MSSSTYNNHHCRCAGCKAAIAEYRRMHKATTRGAETARVHIAIARGVQSVDIMAIWGLTYEQLKAIRDEMAV